MLHDFNCPLRMANTRLADALIFRDLWLNQGQYVRLVVVYFSRVFAFARIVLRDLPRLYSLCAV